MATNKSLSADSLFALVRAGFERIPDRRADNAKISLPDALMSGKVGGLVELEQSFADLLYSYAAYPDEF